MKKKGRPSNREKALKAVMERGRAVAASLNLDDGTPLHSTRGDACGRSAVALPMEPATVTFATSEEVRALYGRNPETRRSEDGSPISGRPPRRETFNEVVLRFWFEDRLLDWVQYVHALRRDWASWPEDHEKPFPAFVRGRFEEDKVGVEPGRTPPREPESRLYSATPREEELPGGGKIFFSRRTKVPLFTVEQIASWYERERAGLTGNEKRPAEEIAHRILRKLVSVRFDEGGDTLPSISDLRRSTLRRKR